MLKKPFRPPTFDRFGDQIIMRVAFADSVDGHTISTVVVDLTKLVKETKDVKLMELVNRLLN